MLAFDLEPPLPRGRQWLTVRDPVWGDGRYVRQTSCPSDAAGVALWLEPYRGTSHFVLVWEVIEEQIPRSFAPAIIKGVQRAALETDPMNALINLRVRVVDGFFHPVDSRPRSYTVAALLAITNALREATLIRTEPPR